MSDTQRQRFLTRKRTAHQIAHDAVEAVLQEAPQHGLHPLDLLEPSSRRTRRHISVMVKIRQQKRNNEVTREHPYVLRSNACNFVP